MAFAAVTANSRFAMQHCFTLEVVIKTIKITSDDGVTSK